MAVEPVELVEVEDGWARRHALEGEGAGQFGEGEGLGLAVFGAPAEEGEVVDQGLGQIAHLAESGSGGGGLQY
jgi:hypothetical protein